MHYITEVTFVHHVLDTALSTIGIKMDLSKIDISIKI